MARVQPVPSPQRLVLQAAQARLTGQDVPSPCVSVCRMDPASGLCEGCWRTIDEICAWSALDAAGRRAVWARIAQRATGAPP